MILRVISVQHLENFNIREVIMIVNLQTDLYSLDTLRLAQIQEINYLSRGLLVRILKDINPVLLLLLSIIYRKRNSRIVFQKNKKADLTKICARLSQ